MDVDANNNRMGDVFKSCMPILAQKRYPTISDFYSGKTVAITGGTSFVGKGLIEKLLRSCPDVKKIILLIAVKHGVNPQDRLTNLCQMPVFDRLRQINHNFSVKLYCIACDLAEKNLGLSNESKQILKNEVEIFIHSAACLRFNEHIRLAYNLNTKYTQIIVDLCKTMPKLVAVVHVSTAFSNCDRSYIEERIYQTKVNYKDLQRSLYWLSDEAIKKVMSDILSGKPNTYVLTKAMAEEVVADESTYLPACIVRHGMLVGAWKEPEPGWIGNPYGPASFWAAYAKGLCRQIIAEPRIAADIVPIDFVVNCVIASAMKTAYDVALRTQAKRRHSSYTYVGTIDYDDSSSESSVENQKDDTKIPIYCMVTSAENPLSLKLLYKLMIYWNRIDPAAPIVPIAISLRYSKTLYQIKCFFTQTMIAYALDLLLIILQQPQIFVRINSKILDLMKVFCFFFTHHFNFSVNNLIALRACLCESDRTEFTTDVTRIDWVEYMRTFNLGIHKFILKEGEAALSNAPRKVALFRGMLRSWKSCGFLLFSTLPASCGSPSAIWDSSFYHWHMRRGPKFNIS